MVRIKSLLGVSGTSFLCFLLLGCDPMAFLDFMAPPLPVILSDSMEKYVSVDGEVGVHIIAKVWNQGGNGDIIFEATVTQLTHDKRKIELSKNVAVHMKGREGTTVSLDFQGLDPEGYEPVYSTNVYPYSK